MLREFYPLVCSLFFVLINAEYLSQNASQKCGRMYQNYFHSVYLHLVFSTLYAAFEVCDLFFYFYYHRYIGRKYLEESYECDRRNYGREKLRY